MILIQKGRRACQIYVHSEVASQETENDKGIVVLTLAAWGDNKIQLTKEQAQGLVEKLNVIINEL